MEKLKPCPFCGGYAMVQTNCYNQNYIRCDKCKCVFWAGLTDKEYVIEAWNRRAKDE